MTYHLHELRGDAQPPKSQIEIAAADGAGEYSYAVTSDREKPLAFLDHSPAEIRGQRMAHLRKLVDDANAAPSMRRELLAIYDELENRYDGAPDSPTRWMGRHIDGIRAALIQPESPWLDRTLNDIEASRMRRYAELDARASAAMNAKLTSDRVLNGLERDIAAYPIYTNSDTQLIIEYGPEDRVFHAPMCPASIASHPDSILHSDDTSPSEAEGGAA